MEYTNFIITATREKTFDLFCYKMLKKGSKSVLQYWLVDGKSWPEVQKIAIKIFGMATSSAAFERNFFHHGIYSHKALEQLKHGDCGDCGEAWICQEQLACIPCTAAVGR
jgi:hAT family C-terminal dimerisation region